MENYLLMSREKLRASESVWASLYLQDWGSGSWSRDMIGGGGRGRMMNKTTRMSQRKKQKRSDGSWCLSKTDRSGVSSEGPGLIKLFLVNTNNTNNQSINLDNHKSDLEPGLVPKWDRCYVCWLGLSCHKVLQCTLVFQCLPRFYNVLWYFSVCH